MAAEEITVTILGRDYRIACAPDERSDLLNCARYVDQKMESIRAGGRVVGTDRIAVLAALQLAQELLSSRTLDGASVADLRRRLREMNAAADELLAPQEKLF